MLYTLLFLAPPFPDCKVFCCFYKAALFGDSIVLSVLVNTSFDNSVKDGLSYSENLNINLTISSTWSEYLLLNCLIAKSINCSPSLA